MKDIMQHLTIIKLANWMRQKITFFMNGELNSTKVRNCNMKNCPILEHLI